MTSQVIHWSTVNLSEATHSPSPEDINCQYFLSEGGSLWALPPCESWTQEVTGAVSSWVPWSCHFQKMLWSSPTCDSRSLPTSSSVWSLWGRMQGREICDWNSTDTRLLTVVSFSVSCCSQHKETSLVRSESCSNLYLEICKFRGQSETMPI